MICIGKTKCTSQKGLFIHRQSWLKGSNEKYFLLRMHTFCFATLSLKRSKSVRDARFFLEASFLAQAVFSHFSRISPFSNALLTGPLPADGPIFTLKSVSDRYLKFRALRQTLVHGPSIRACLKRAICISLEDSSDEITQITQMEYSIIIIPFTTKKGLKQNNINKSAIMKHGLFIQ